MLRITIISVIVAAVAGLCFFSCTTCARQDDEDLFNNMPEYDGELQVANEVVETMIRDIASPIEMAYLIKSIDVPFSRDYLASTKVSSTFITSSEQAFALGVYGTDLGYINMYEKTSSVLKYISVMKDLANEINIGQFFDFNTLKDLATNSENIDSLMYISQRSFTRMDEYLRESHRSKLSALMIAGVWIEGMNIVARVAQEKRTKEIGESIADQKIVLQRLLIVLKNYSKDPMIANMVDLLDDIALLYEDVKIVTIQGDPTVEEGEDGTLVVKYNDVTTIDMSDETLDAIINKSIEVRNKLINVE
jgi:hypothetical protein